MLPLSILVGGILSWGLQRIVDQQQERLELNFSAAVASIKEQEVFLQQSKFENRSLPGLLDHQAQEFKENPFAQAMSSWIVQERSSMGGMPYSLQCSSKIDCVNMSDELFRLGNYLAANYSSFWARSSFPAAPVFYINEDASVSISIPAIGVAVGNESASKEMFVASIATIKENLRNSQFLKDASMAPSAGAPPVAWFSVPDFPEKIVGLLPFEVADRSHSSNEPRKMQAYAATLFSRNRLGRVSIPQHQFWLRHRDYGVLMGQGENPAVDKGNFKYALDGLTIKAVDASGTWTGYYKMDYPVLFEGGLRDSLGTLFLLLMLSIAVGIVYTRRFNRQVIAPAQNAQQAILESDEFNRTLIETAPVAICLVAHGTGEIVFRNSLAQEWLQSRNGHLQPESLSNVQALHAVVNARYPGTMERIEVAQGRTLHLSYAPTRYMGKKVTLCIFADVSARAETEKNLEQAKLAADEANEAKSTFLATMSHEIRTPLYGALGTLEILGMTDLTSVQRKYVERIEDSSTILLQIISDILDTSKIEAGQLQLENSPFNPRDLVQSCTSAYAALAQQKGVLLFSCVDAQVPVAVIGDPVRIRQILNNLISNAIKFTQAGHVIIRLYQADSEAAQARMVFEVSDTGVGIEKTLHSRLFTPFFLIKNSHRTARGAGLGLSICWRLAQMMGSLIQVKSEPGLGSKFWFELALKTVPGAVESSPALGGIEVAVRSPHPELTENICAWLRHWGALAHPAGRNMLASHPDELLLDVLQPLSIAEPDWSGRHLSVSSAGQPCDTGEIEGQIDGHSVWSIGHGIVAAVRGTPRTVRPAPVRPQFALRVLVAEDNPVNQITLRGQLESLGCEVTVADDGAEALAFWDISPHDVVLTDVNMPYLNGYELTERLRSEGVTCPIIGVTANAMLDEESRCLSAGMNAWLVKPIQLRTLVSMFEKFAPRQVLPAANGAFTAPLAVPQGEPNVLEMHRTVFMQCMKDDVQTLARSLDEDRPDLAIHALHRMRGALLLARLQTFATRTENLERQIQSDGLDENLRGQLASALVDLRALLARL